MKNFIILGAPGAGKGTQARLLAKKYKLIHISSGDILRQEIQNGKLGKKIKKYLAEGRLVPEKIIDLLIDEKIKSHSQAAGFIFDGFPRTISQAKILNKMLRKEKRSVTAVFEIQVNETESAQRILERSKTSGRSDDNLLIIKKRFEIYYHEIKPMVNYYKNQKKLIIINGNNQINKIHKDLVKNIKLLTE